MAKLILGTRGSKLALAQSEMIAARLRALHPGLTVELQIITTRGDRVLDVALSAVGDKGLFVKELEQALLAHEVDLCVHSCKDLPSLVPDGLALAAFPERASPLDVVVTIEQAGAMRSPADAAPGAEADGVGVLPMGAVVGTSSLRRAAQLRTLRPDLELRDVRGNVDTRLRKLAEGQYDALILAAAGLDRLGLVGAGGRLLSDGVAFVARPIPAEQMLPAVAQGTLAIECRADDHATLALLAPLDHVPTRAAALAERSFLRRLEGGCQVPIAAYATCDIQPLAGAPATSTALNDSCDTLHLRGLVASLDGATTVRGERSGPAGEPEVLGSTLADELIARGAATILAALATRMA